MSWNPAVLRAYLNHFLPRDVFGPVIIVFSLEGVIDGLFNLYVPDEAATLGWGIVFVFALLIVAYWGTADPEAREELEERVEDIEDQETAGSNPN